ncbi:hypothetical protein SXCC_03966 [Gluconacetobacter sp. SXCC-1]|nr:hypothetical protein SXCC_03966 [Gluconacetobacter sp. SXCC-1]
MNLEYGEPIMLRTLNQSRRPWNGACSPFPRAQHRSVMPTPRQTVNIRVRGHGPAPLPGVWCAGRSGRTERRRV